MLYIDLAYYSPPCLCRAVDIHNRKPHIVVDSVMYRSYINTVNNIIMPATLIFFNAFLILSIRYKRQNSSSHVNELQKQVGLCTAKTSSF
uniref:G_PROTEIN_RECEP_F1_2 domain-containing protein n=1 Tax=Steinernema glaseri TaxID=37863 RepID=A0A1I7YZ72_9BILA